MDKDDMKDAERFQWLLRRGVAWRGCYNHEWRKGEWLYSFHTKARELIDKEIENEKRRG